MHVATGQDCRYHGSWFIPPCKPPMALFNCSCRGIAVDLVVAVHIGLAAAALGLCPGVQKHVIGPIAPR